MMIPVLVSPPGSVERGKRSPGITNRHKGDAREPSADDTPGAPEIGEPVAVEAVRDAGGRSRRVRRQAAGDQAKVALAVEQGRVVGVLKRSRNDS